LNSGQPLKGTIGRISRGSLPNAPYAIPPTLPCTALLVLLLAIDNGYQGCLMAPTEILAQQHFANITNLLKDLPVSVKLLTGSTKAKDRKVILKGLEAGDVHIIIGTHAVIEDTVRFRNLGIAIVDDRTH
jgi:ATP-dependent DNA helicase RecG